MSRNNTSSTLRIFLMFFGQKEFVGLTFVFCGTPRNIEIWFARLKGANVTDNVQIFMILQKIFMENVDNIPNKINLNSGMDNGSKESSTGAKAGINYKSSDSSNSNDEKKEVQYKCDQCRYWSNSKCFITSHFELEHEENFYPCYICNFKVTINESIRAHKESIYENINK